MHSKTSFSGLLTSGIMFFSSTLDAFKSLGLQGAECWVQVPWPSRPCLESRYTRQQSFFRSVCAFLIFRVPHSVLYKFCSPFLLPPVSSSFLLLLHFSFNLFCVCVLQDLGRADLERFFRKCSYFKAKQWNNTQTRVPLKLITQPLYSQRVAQVAQR